MLLAAFVERFPWLMSEASQQGNEDLFGLSVVVEGDTAIVGAPFQDDETGQDTGRVHIYERNRFGQWVHTQVFGGPAGSHFGVDVALHDDTFVVGADHDSSEGGANAGAAFVFSRGVAGGWHQIDKITPLDPSSGANFGVSVDIEDDSIVVGAPFNSSSGHFAGAAYVFARSGDRWVEQEKLRGHDTVGEDRFGRSVAIENNTVVVNAITRRTAYVFELQSHGEWQETYQTFAPGITNLFGIDLAISGSTIAIGDAGANGGRGAVYLLERVGSAWTAGVQIRPADLSNGDQFGRALAINENKIVVGSFDDDPGGSAYVFEKNSFGNWVEAQKLVANGVQADDAFGLAVALDKRTILIGAPFHDRSWVNNGLVYAFEDADIDAGGVIDGLDIDMLIVQAQSAMPDPRFDLNHDGNVNTQDVDYLVVNLLNTRPADTNLDGSVDGQDFLVWQRGLGASGASASWAAGNADYDGDVDGGDLERWIENYGFASAAPSPSIAGNKIEGTEASAQSERELSDRAVIVRERAIDVAMEAARFAVPRADFEGGPKHLGTRLESRSLGPPTTAASALPYAASEGVYRNALERSLKLDEPPRYQVADALFDSFLYLPPLVAPIGKEMAEGSFTALNSPFATLFGISM